MPIDALSVLCAQLTRNLFATAKFLFYRALTRDTDIAIMSVSPLRSGIL